MNAVDRFLGRFVHPLWERRDGVRFRGHLAGLERSERWPVERLREEQARRLAAMVRHAYETVPFHRERLAAAGYRAGDSPGPEDLVRIPILEKSDLREQGEALLSTAVPPARLGRKRTGGSTGVPVVTWLDHPSWDRKLAATWRANRWAGYTMGDTLAMVWGNEPEPRGFPSRLRRALYERRFALDTLRVNPATMRAFLDRSAREHPRHLMGHAHSVYLLAAFALEEGRRDVRFDSVITTAMVLLPAERAVIERAFAAPVFDRYGCEELSIIAAECEAHDGLHLHAEGLIAEVLVDGRPAAPGEYGELVLTDLLNRGMPLLRYRVGDVSAMMEGPCRCGRTLPRLREVRGRTADFLVTPEGDRVFGISVLDTMLIHVPGIRQGQLVQERRDELRVRLVVDEERFAAGGEARLLAELPRYFGPTMRYRVERVPRIDPEPNGKYRFAVCRIDNPAEPV